MFDLNLDCGKHVAFNLTKDQVAIIMGHPACAERVLRIGLKNIIGDSHAGVTREGFKTDEEWHAAKLAKAGETVKALLAGEVRVARTAGPRVDDFTNAVRRFVLGLLSKADRKALAEMEDGVRVAKLDAIFAANEAKLRPQIEASVEAERIAREAKAVIAADLAITL